MTDTLNPPRIAIAYFSGNGHTRRLAEAVIFDAPTYIGSTAARYDMLSEKAAGRWNN